MRIAFKNVGDGLKTSDGAAPRTFELVASGDKGVACDAKIVRKTVVELTVPADMPAPTPSDFPRLMEKVSNHWPGSRAITLAKIGSRAS